MVKKTIVIIYFIFASTCLWSGEILPEKQSLATLQNTIERYMLNQLAHFSEGKISVVAGKLDERLNLKACADEYLEIFNPYDTPVLTTSTMGIKCRDKKVRWTVYIPVKVMVLKTVLLTKNTLKKGDKIKADDLYQAELDAQKLKQGYFTQSKDLVGMVCKRDIAADTPVNPYHIELEKLVLRGQEISIIATRGSLNVSMDGIALHDGSLGDTIKVRNTSSKRVLEAQVSGNRTVRVTM